MRVTSAFKRLLRLEGVNVTGVEFGARTVTVTVALRRRKLHCPLCAHRTTAAYENRRRDVSRWRHLDLGTWRLEVRAELRRLRCPTHGVRVEAVPFARHASGFSTDFEVLVAFLATRTDKTTITRLVRIDWETVSRICARVVADELDPSRLDGLFEIGVDEVSWRKHHNYLTLVTNHRNSQGGVGGQGQGHQGARRLLRRARPGAIGPDHGRVDGHGPGVHPQRAGLTATPPRP